MNEMEKESLRARLPAWLREHGYPLTRSFRCLSPAHQDRHPSMRYNPKNQTVHCFSCGASFDVFDLVGMEEGLDAFPQRLEAVRRRYGGGAPAPSCREKGKQEAPDLTGFARAGAAARREEDYAWFAARGLRRETVERFGLFVQDGRAVLPVWRQGRCVSWCARALAEDGSPRYLNSPGPMGIWGVDALWDSAGAPVAVCEGAFDALSLEQCGCPALALCGAANVGRLEEELRRLPGPPPPLLLAADRDEAGERMARRLEEALDRLGGRHARLDLPAGCKDVNAALVERPRELEQALARAREELELAGRIGREDYEAGSFAGMAGEFLAYLDESRRRPALSSGLDGLDGLLGGGLWPGLYVLGAPSSLGKTTLLLQMADALAAAGRDVLFFSLEMGRWELLAKSLSRRAGLRQAAAMRQILQDGIDRTRLEKLLEEYNRECGRRFFVVEEPLSPAQLAQRAREHREKRGAAPVVFVDYLQILPPADPRASDKQNVDRAVLQLKALSRELDAPVLAASSFNRESYGKGASMEAFKESGAVEYAADVLLALQLSAFGREGFDPDREKAADPRKEDLLVLKNRNGPAFGRLPLHYHAAANLFREAPLPGPAAAEPGAVHRIGKRR